MAIGLNSEKTIHAIEMPLNQSALKTLPIPLRPRYNKALIFQAVAADC